MTTGNRVKSSVICRGGVYVHVPFCRKKCPYCHFAVRPHKDAQVPSYLRSIRKEWESKQDLLDEVTTLYFGGGTPSLLSEQELEELFLIFPSTLGEITLEANPEDVTYPKFCFLKELGINRISLGAQSFSNERLSAIGRNHTAEDTIRAVEICKKAGFDNISIDLMYDLPNQTFTEWQTTVAQAIQLPITHLSLYNMTFEPGALYFKDRHALKQLLPNGEVSTKMLLHAIAVFESSGLKRYEISAFAKEGFCAQHNTSYWTAKPFLGIGPSAFSYYEGSRFKNSSHFPKWQAQVDSGLDCIEFEEQLAYPDNVHELFVVQLRLLAGVNLSEFDLPEQTLQKVSQLIDGGYLKKESHFLSLTERGTLFYDTVASELI